MNHLNPPWTRRALRTLLLSSLLATGAAGAWAQAAARDAPARTADYIVAIVNQELVTAGELEARIARIREQAARAGARLPSQQQLRHEVLEQLIDERVLITHARENGPRVDPAELDRAVANVAQQNQVTLAQLRERLQREGLDFTRFQRNVRDQLMVERVREREVQARIQVNDAEIETFLEQQRARARGVQELNIAQVLVGVPDGASDDVVAARRARAQQALDRIRAGEDFAGVAREMSEDGNRANGGEIGLKPVERLPEVFIEQVRALQPGQVAPELLRTGAGFHVLKLVERRAGDPFAITQTHARHILLRTSEQLSQEAAGRRLAQFKRQIESGAATFEQLARANSEDGSAPQGGDLGWVSPGSFVPEFEQAMNTLPTGGISDPVPSRFGVHLIQVIERRQTSLDARQQREQARQVLRERKFEQAYVEWLRELRARSYVELREPPG